MASATTKELAASMPQAPPFPSSNLSNPLAEIVSLGATADEAAQLSAATGALDDRVIRPAAVAPDVRKQMFGAGISVIQSIAEEPVERKKKKSQIPQFFGSFLGSKEQHVSQAPKKGAASNI
jgi:hypothetical protein